jgi:hypothetical protein
VLATAVLLGSVADWSLCTCNYDAARGVTGQKGTTMKTIRIMAAALLAGGVAIAGLGPGAGTAQADPDPNYGPHQWCPGQPKTWPNYPATTVNWDSNICHTWYYVGYGLGNVPGADSGPSTIWDGDNPPPNDAIHPCSPLSWMCTRS